MGGEFEVYEYLDDNKIFDSLKRFPDDKKSGWWINFRQKVVNFSFFCLPLTHAMESQNLFQMMKPEFLYTAATH